MDTESISFKKWEGLFVRGKTSATYLAVISFSLFDIAILYSRLFLFYFIISEIGAFTAFGVLVDYVSHLFNDEWESPVSREEWISRFKHGRTHDTYGLIIEMSCFFILGFRFPLLTGSIIFLIPQIYIVYKLRFYH
ncbi:hypothetical protein [Cuniculiplasma divulgatum]|jgi:hypothetical protein|nr:hypothetical protein [Cuniculiplasma divulgatum]MCI2413394.1 hypothetical protein [Cuniculiplasma sp.]MCL4319713.1 hypothetical protein [Candidatus Thermoplasmatota archaeon]OWP54984.1 MAG: hypothetical protein B2I18_07255 [Cuniculiplasma sp. C_DKE]WMT48452.1 MAG: hypothetical protein RE472_05080 [Thermoplasmatales archaeon]MCL6015095.1 hypothetical protein [Candidatus Thermoplasmatota archaeon]